MNRVDRNAAHWINTTGARLISGGPDIFFAVPAQYISDKLEILLRNFDQTLTHGKILKNSPTTTAALVECAGQNLFFKRTNNKNWKFTLRYLFRSARAFRSAAAAEKLLQLGIPTPPVIAAGERRRGLILKCGYLVTESEPGICGMDHAIMASSKPLETMADFLEKAAGMMAQLHRNNVLHGDLKLCNFYRAGNGEPGIWDLDSMKVFRKKIPIRKIETEITRLLASCVAVQELIPGLSKPEIDRMAEEFCRTYCRISVATPSAKNVADLIRARLNRWRNKK